MGIVVSDISYSIDGTKILDSVSAEAKKGMIGIIGPNGAGKTTLLRVISGYIRPDCGTVTVYGRDIRDIDIKSRARLMALVPQNYAMDYDFSVMEIVLMGRNPHKKKYENDTAYDYELARECIKKAGIYGLEERSIMGLSGGEWQRMVIARALCQQSKILLMDEPVSSLDIKHQASIMDMVRDLVDDNGLISMCVLHDLNLAYNYCDSVILMKNGRIYAHGEPERVMNKETIEEVYDTDVNIITDSGKTYIMPVLRKAGKDAPYG